MRSGRIRRAVLGAKYMRIMIVKIKQIVKNQFMYFKQIVRIMIVKIKQIVKNQFMYFKQIVRIMIVKIMGLSGLRAFRAWEKKYTKEGRTGTTTASS